MNRYDNRLHILTKEYDELISRENEKILPGNGVFERYKYPILTAEHPPLEWRYDFNPETNPYLMERFGINAVFNAGAIKFNGKYLVMARVEGHDRKSFFAIAESPNGIDNFRFWEYPVQLPDLYPEETNVYDMRLTKHEDGWIYGIFCSESKDPDAPAGDLTSAIAAAGIIRSRDLKNWERLPNLVSQSQQRNVVLHPVIKKEIVIEQRHYHTIKEVKNGEGPHPIKTPQGWLHLAHGVRACAAGLRYVLYLYMTSLDDPRKVIAQPGGYFMAPVGEERTGDVSNVLFSNGWIADEDGTVYIYYASSDTRMHVATSTIERLIDYCRHTPEDRLRSTTSVKSIYDIIEANKLVMSENAVVL